LTPNIPAQPHEEPLASLVKLIAKYGPEEVMEAMSIVEIYAHEPDNLSYSAVRYDENGKLIYMDREIMNAEDDEIVIHLNGDSLDCRRENMILQKTEC
jgi:hypothetical protein